MTDTPEDALEELIARRSAIHDFKSKANITLKSRNKQLKLKCQIEYDEEEGWHIEIKGPVGVKVAVIDADDENYTAYFPLVGRTKKGQVNESIEIPELNFNLPDISILTKPFIPVLDINSDDNWRIKSVEMVRPAKMILIRESDNEAEILELELDFSPLKTYSEKRFLNGELLFSREFVYRKDNSSLPEKFNIVAGELTMMIKYNSLQINLQKRPAKHLQEPL